MNPQEAIRYFGLSNLDELEDLVVDHGLEAQLGRNHELEGVQGGAPAREALFTRHESAVGHRPDDRAAGERERKKALDREGAARRRRKAKRATLEGRVAARRKGTKHRPFLDRVRSIGS